MAFKAYLAAPVVVAAEKVVATFLYYDDTDPLNANVSALNPPAAPIHSEGFAFPPEWTNAQMQAAVQARGVQVRAAKQKADALNVSFPVGFLISIP